MVTLDALKHENVTLHHARQERSKLDTIMFTLDTFTECIRVVRDSVECSARYHLYVH